MIPLLIGGLCIYHQTNCTVGRLTSIAVEWIEYIGRAISAHQRPNWTLGAYITSSQHIIKHHKGPKSPHHNEPEASDTYYVHYVRFRASRKVIQSRRHQVSKERVAGDLRALSLLIFITASSPSTLAI